MHDQTRVWRRFRAVPVEKMFIGGNRGIFRRTQRRTSLYQHGRPHISLVFDRHRRGERLSHFPEEEAGTQGAGGARSAHGRIRRGAGERAVGRTGTGQARPAHRAPEGRAKDATPAQAEADPSVAAQRRGDLPGPVERAVRPTRAEARAGRRHRSGRDDRTSARPSDRGFGARVALRAAGRISNGTSDATSTGYPNRHTEKA